MILYDVLQLPVLRSARLLTDPALEKDREISAVSVIEVPVGQFVRFGEFVMSTGMNVGRDPRLLARFVEDIAGAGGAALALAIGPYTPAIPKRLVAAASKRLPLIALPWEVRFSEISEAILRRLIQDQAAIRTRHDFVWSLASGNLHEDAALSQGKHLGIDLRLQSVGVLGRCSAAAKWPGGDAQTHVWFVENLCFKMAAHRQLQWLGTVAGDSIIGYLQVPGSGQGVHPMLQSIRVPGRSGAISWGVGRVCRDFGDFHKSYEEARTACEIGACIRGEGCMTDISDVLAERILLNLGRHSDVFMLLERYVNPLQAFRRMSLIDTVEAFFAADCNASETARKLSISRQALLYRLAKVEALLRVDLGNAEHRFAMGLALRLRRLQEAAAPAKLLS
ncbi:MAG: PucR family transcriptional regulator ligand-binding domain-containing protein [Candidatus Solibacter sp.]|jgi:hypothetical protein